MAANGAFHKHLSAFLQDSTGSSDASASPGTGVYVAQLQVNVSGLTSSDPIFAVYGNGVSQTAVDRTKFYLRNNLAPRSTLLGMQTSLVGLSAAAGDTNLASSSGTLAVTGTTRTSPVNTLTTSAIAGSVAIAGLTATETTYVVLWMNGSAGNISSAIAHLDIPGEYDIAPANAGVSDPLYAEIQRLAATYSGFSAVVEFKSPASNTAFNWGFYADTSVTLSQAAVAGFSVANLPIYWKDTSGSWDNLTNWTGGVIPSGTSAVALFGGSPAYSGAHTVTLDGSKTAGTVSFNSSYSVTLLAGSGGTLVMDNGARPGLISVMAGSQTVGVGVSAAATGLNLSVVEGSTLTFGGSLAGGPVSVAGAGVVSLASTALTNAHASALVATGLTVAAGGSVRVPYVDRAARLQSRCVAVGSISDSGVVDLTDNDMLLHSGSEGAINGLIAAGRLISSVAGTGTANDRLALLAVVVNSNGAGGPLYASFDGLAALAGDVLVRYTYGGDTDLNGMVDASDLANYLAGRNGHLSGWVNGDFNRDGVVDNADLAILMASLRGQGPGFGSPLDGGGGGGEGSACRRQAA